MRGNPSVISARSLVMFSRTVTKSLSRRIVASNVTRWDIRQTLAGVKIIRKEAVNKKISSALATSTEDAKISIKREKEEKESTCTENKDSRRHSSTEKDSINSAIPQQTTVNFSMTLRTFSLLKKTPTNNLPNDGGSLCREGKESS